jgi:hypothetical protein
MSTARGDRPHHLRFHTNTWTAYGAQLNADDVLTVLDRVDDHFDAARASLQPDGDSPAVTVEAPSREDGQR